MLNRYSKTITQVFLGKRIYIYHTRELMAIVDENDKKVYIEPGTRKFKTVMDCINDMYGVKWQNFEITDCYCITNLVK